MEQSMKFLKGECANVLVWKRRNNISRTFERTTTILQRFHRKYSND